MPTLTLLLSVVVVRAAAMTVPTLTLPGTLDKMPAIGYGTWLSKPGEVYDGTKAALQCGYRHIDEAWVYMNEEEVGKAIADCVEDGTLRSHR